MNQPHIRKTVHCKTLFTHIREWIHHQLSYIDIHLSHVLCNVIGQLRTSSDQLEIEVVDMHEYLKKEECSNCFIKELNMKNIMFVIVLLFMKLEGDIIASLNKALAHYAR